MERKLAEAYRRQEVATKLRVSVRTVDDLIMTGELRSFRIGKRRLVSEDALAAFIKKQEQEAAAKG